MQPTALGLVVVSISLFFVHRPVRLLQVALLASVFEAGAAFVIGGTFGLPTAMVPGLLLVGYVALQYLLGMRYPGERLVLWALLPLLLFLANGLLTAAVLPDMFSGMVTVWPQKLDPLAPAAVPLAPSTGNITQSLYLTVNVAVATFSALFLSRALIPYRGILGTYLASGYLVVLISFWQFASRVGGVPFPKEFFFSNPGWTIVEQNLGSLPRLQGPFAEPSALGHYMTGVAFCCLWLSLRGHQVMKPQLLLGLSVVTVFVSTSTTGIVAVAVGMPLVLAYSTRRGGGQGLRRAGVTLGVLLAGALAIIGPLIVLNPELIAVVNQVAEFTLSKNESDSFSERLGWDADALEAVIATAGLGVGWGSFRSSTLIPGLLANGGVIGLALVLWLGVRIARLSSRAASTAALPAAHQGRAAVDGFSAALCGQLAAALLSAPTITSVAFFLQLACVVGAAARLLMDGHSAAARRWQPGVGAAEAKQPSASSERPSESPTGVVRLCGSGAAMKGLAEQKGRAV